jgi:hypothetical protein
VEEVVLVDIAQLAALEVLLQVIQVPVVLVLAVGAG